MHAPHPWSKVCLHRRRSWLGFDRCRDALAAYPHKIRSSKQAEKLPYIGPKVSNMVRQPPSG